MRTILLGLSAVALSAVATPVLAQDTAAPESEFTVSGGATVVTDYRFRGISQTDRRFAVQGTLGVAHSSGFYVGTWGSSVDDYVAAGSDQEIDLYGGYKGTFGAATVDAGVLYYYFPGSNGANTDFFEPYASISGALGPVTAKVGVTYAPKQHAIANTRTRDDNLYVYGDLSGAIPDTGVSITGHVGRNFERSLLTFGTRYTDWSLGASYTWNAITFGVSYVDTNRNFRGIRTDGTVTRRLSKAGVVGSIGVAF